MTNQNNAAQPVLTDDEIRAVWVEHGLDDEAVEDFARAIESALLSKLRAPVADERAAFDAKLGAHVREWARRWGWEPGDAEGAWEYAQRLSYEAGRRDAAPYWARSYEAQDDYDEAVADAIKRVAVRIEFAARNPNAHEALTYLIDVYDDHRGGEDQATRTYVPEAWDDALQKARAALASEEKS